MPTQASHQRSYVYAGLAGETTPGRVVQSGLYRKPAGDSEWEILSHGLPEAPAIRAIAVHPQQPEIVYVGTQVGPYRSTDHGDHWEKVNVPDHGPARVVAAFPSARRQSHVRRIRELRDLPQ